MSRFNKLYENLVAEALTQKEMMEIFLPKIKAGGKNYVKKTEVLARPATVGEKIVTITSGGKETENIAKEGDLVVRNKTGAKEEYILTKEKFEKRYQKTSKKEDGMDVYLATGSCRGFTFEGAEHSMANKIEFIADWGEKMVMTDGDMVVTPLPAMNEIYRIGRKEFEETYELSK